MARSSPRAASSRANGCIRRTASCFGSTTPMLSALPPWSTSTAARGVDACRGRSRNGSLTGKCFKTDATTRVPNSVPPGEEGLLPFRVEVNWEPRRVVLLRCAASGEAEPPSSSGPGRRPFKAVTGIRTPLGAPSAPPATEASAHLVLWCSLECTPPCQGGGRGFKSRQDRGRPVASAACLREAG